MIRASTQTGASSAVPAMAVSAMLCPFTAAVAQLQGLELLAQLGVQVALGCLSHFSLPSTVPSAPNSTTFQAPLPVSWLYRTLADGSSMLMVCPLLEYVRFHSRACEVGAY